MEYDAVIAWDADVANEAVPCNDPVNSVALNEPVNPYEPES